MEDDFRQALSLGDGQVLSGKYRVGALLGLEDMGSVFAAHDLLLDAPVIIRCLRPSLLADAEAVAAFEREAQGSIDSGTLTTGVPYIVLEFLAGSGPEVEGRSSPAALRGSSRATFALVAALLFLVAGAMSLAFGGRRSETRSRAMAQAASTPPVRHPIEIASFVVPNSATEDRRGAVLPSPAAASPQARVATAEPRSRSASGLDRRVDEDDGSSSSSSARRQSPAKSREASGRPPAKAPAVTQSGGATLAKTDDCRPSFDFDEQGRRHFTACASAPSRLGGAAPRPSSACSPSFELDDQGRKHFKPECFLEAKPEEKPEAKPEASQMAARSRAR